MQLRVSKITKQLWMCSEDQKFTRFYSAIHKRWVIRSMNTELFRKHTKLIANNFKLLK